MPPLLNRLLIAIVVVVGVPAILVGYLALVEWLMERLPSTRQRQVRPWLWIGPVLVLGAFYLVYPALNTIGLSLRSADSSRYVGLENYRYFFTSGNTLVALRNNALWLVFLTVFTVGLGFLFAVLFDRIRSQGEAVAKAFIFLPMAISFVAAGVIWKLMYDYISPGRPQTGTLNEVVTLFGGQPVPWLINRITNNGALITVGVWMWTGFALVILSAGLKGISKEILEAARMDGANEWQILWGIIVPMISPTITVVATTMVINALKAFDIVYVMTSGNYATDVMANRMYTEMFIVGHYGRASAIAVVLLLAIAPVMAVNIRRFRIQEALR